MSFESIPLIDLNPQNRLLRPQIEQAIAKVLDHGQFVMGAEIEAMEQELARFCQAKYTLSCANGTEAIALLLRAYGIGAGDAVFVPDFTFIATAGAVALVGATPVMTDVMPSSYNLSPQSLRDAFALADKMGLRKAAVLAVDIFGLPADYEALSMVCQEHGVPLFADSAQSFGANIQGGKKVGTLAEATTTSFFPAKPLGCYGDGGAIFLDDPSKIEVLKSIRVHGQGRDKYENIRIGTNGRMDTLQAAIILEKLKIFPDEIKKRDQVARFYQTKLDSLGVQYQIVPEGVQSAWAQFTLELPSSVDRTQCMAFLKEQGIGSAIYYPIPLSKQKAYQHFPQMEDLSVSARLCQSVMSLPMYPYLTEEQTERVMKVFADAISKFA